MTDSVLDCDVLVVGSGPGGSMTAHVLAQAGRDVLLVEEGRHLPTTSAPAHSAEEMSQKWRYGGLSTTLGLSKVTCIEGLCVGGASETNAGLYHPPPAEILDDWAQRYQIQGFGAAELEGHLQAMQALVPVSRHPDGPSTISRRLEHGASTLGWNSVELPRFWRYERQPDGRLVGVRQSMTQSLIPRAVEAGCRLLSESRVIRLHGTGSRFTEAEIEVRQPQGVHSIRVRFATVFVCAGAIQTALLLRRSGLRHHIGNTLTLNPMIRILARFQDPVNEPGRGVPVQQVEAFKPAMTLGCSHSSPAHLALWLTGDPARRARLLESWRHLAILYVKIAPTGRGSVRNVPWVDQSLLRFPVGQNEYSLLSIGLERLGRLAFACGAVEVFHPIAGAPSVTRPVDAVQLGMGIGPGKVALSAIHLHSTVPMGEVASAAANSFGCLPNVEGVRVNDSSLLPDTPGINPQGMILAIARRNAMAFLEGR